MKLIEKDFSLSGDLVTVTSLQIQDIEPLLKMAQDDIIWKHLPFNGMDVDNLRRELKAAILLKSSGEHHPFCIRTKRNNTIIGSTRFFDIYPQHKKLEIGWTWLNPNYWGKGHNLECKLLLLTHCFEQLQLNRVQLKTRPQNIRSQSAIKKIGGQLEGILRKDRILSDGSVKDTLVYSIIAEEWTACKTIMQQLLAAQRDKERPTKD